MINKNQAGATMWSTMAIGLMVAFFALMVFKLIPEYIDHGIIKSSMQQIVNKSNFKEMSQRQILTAMQKRMMIDNIRGFNKKAFQVKLEKSGEKFILIKYDRKLELVSNISFLIEFEDEIRRGN